MAFSVAVNCASGATPHQHVLSIEPGDRTYGVAPAGMARLQYTCPLTGESAIAAFVPPPDALRPYKITAIENV